MYNGKITFLKFKWIQKVITKTKTSYSDGLESSPCGEDEEQNRRRLKNPKSSTR